LADRALANTEFGGGGGEIGQANNSLKCAKGGEGHISDHISHINK